MKIGVKVGDIMTRNLISISPDTSILDSAKIMIKKKTGSLLLLENGMLKGIVTEKDIIWAIAKRPVKELAKIKCSDISPRKITTIKPSADLYSALTLMKRSGFRRLPVVLKKRVIGLLTLKDILRIEPALFDIAKGTFEISEESEKLKRMKTPGKFIEGVCEECGNPNLLEKVDSRLLCSSCIDKM